jgi:hypothetical protein
MISSDSVEISSNTVLLAVFWGQACDVFMQIWSFRQQAQGQIIWVLFLSIDETFAAFLMLKQLGKQPKRYFPKLPCWIFKE